MKQRYFFYAIGIGILALVLVMVLPGGEKAECFVQGCSVVPSPVGELVAVEWPSSGEWAVYDRSRGKLGAFTAAVNCIPIWLLGEKGRSLAFSCDEGVEKVSFGKIQERTLLIADQGSRPVQALEGGRILVAYDVLRDDESGTSSSGGTSGLRAFSICPNMGKQPGDRSAEVHEIMNEGALCLRASRDGDKVSYVVETDEEACCIVVLGRGTEGEGFEELLRIEDALCPLHFWSGRGRYMAFLSTKGGVEIYDFAARERHWITAHGLDTSRLTQFWLEFDSEESRINLDMVDEQGFRQLSVVQLDEMQENRFTSGWVHHYHPVLSSDDRFLSYRQSDLPEMSSDFQFTEEEIYLFDYRNQSCDHVCTRMISDGIVGQAGGPAFSADNLFLYFAKNGCIYRYSLPE